MSYGVHKKSVSDAHMHAHMHSLYYQVPTGVRRGTTNFSNMDTVY